MVFLNNQGRALTGQMGYWEWYWTLDEVSRVIRRETGFWEAHRHIDWRWLRASNIVMSPPLSMLLFAFGHVTSSCCKRLGRPSRTTAECPEQDTNSNRTPRSSPDGTLCLSFENSLFKLLTNTKAYLSFLFEARCTTWSDSTRNGWMGYSLPNGFHSESEAERGSHDFATEVKRSQAKHTDFWYSENAHSILSCRQAFS